MGCDHHSSALSNPPSQPKGGAAGPLPTSSIHIIYTRNPREEDMPKKVVLTGACGKIAGQILPALEERYDVVLADARNTRGGSSLTIGVRAHMCAARVHSLSQIPCRVLSRRRKSRRGRDSSWCPRDRPACTGQGPSAPLVCGR